jgi:hypothetical protein
MYQIFLGPPVNMWNYENFLLLIQIPFKAKHLPNIRTRINLVIVTGQWLYDYWAVGLSSLCNIVNGCTTGWGQAIYC